MGTEKINVVANDNVLIPSLFAGVFWFFLGFFGLCYGKIWLLTTAGVIALIMTVISAVCVIYKYRTDWFFSARIAVSAICAIIFGLIQCNEGSFLMFFILLVTFPIMMSFAKRQKTIDEASYYLGLSLLSGFMVCL